VPSDLTIVKESKNNYHRYTNSSLDPYPILIL